MQGFPPELRPLLGLVIVLAIAHMFMKLRARKAAARGRSRASRPDARMRPRDLGGAAVTPDGPGLRAAAAAPVPSGGSVASATSGSPIDQLVPEDPAEALRFLRERASGPQP